MAYTKWKKFKEFFFKCSTECEYILMDPDFSILVAWFKQQQKNNQETFKNSLTVL